MEAIMEKTLRNTVLSKVLYWHQIVLANNFFIISSHIVYFSLNLYPLMLLGFIFHFHSKYVSPHFWSNFQLRLISHIFINYLLLVRCHQQILSLDKYIPSATEFSFLLPWSPLRYKFLTPSQFSSRCQKKRLIDVPRPGSKSIFILWSTGKERIPAKITLWPFSIPLFIPPLENSKDSTNR